MRKTILNLFSPIMTESEMNKVFADLETGTKSGDSHDNTNIYAKLDRAAILGKDALLLSMLWVPVDMRRKGVAKRILTFLEQKADNAGVTLVVGPIMEDEDGNAFLGDLCASRGYKPVMPWSYARIK